MEQVSLGNTGLTVSRVAMGCIPIQRVSAAEATTLLRRAVDAGVNFFDTAHVYGDSEEKLGQAFAGGLRDRVVIATKAMADSYEQTMTQLEESLRRLRTDRVDLYQWHNPQNFENFREGRGPYQAMLDAQKAGKIRHIGITNHSLKNAWFAIESTAFATLQFPLSVLSSPEEMAMAEECARRGMGVIAMKAMCGGLLPDGRVPFAFLNQYRHIVPIWGVERWEEMAQFIDLANHPEAFTDAMRAEVETIRSEYGDDFCRGCGYCLPCPAGINLPIMMRVALFVRRNAPGSQFNPERLAEVERIAECTGCRLCAARCPYHLDPPKTLPGQRDRYLAMCADWKEREGTL